MNRKYNYLIKNLPLEKCPGNLADEIIKKSGILNNPNKQFECGLRTRHFIFNYALACVITAILILSTIGFDLSSPQRVPPERLAINTVSLVDSLSMNLTIAICSYGRSFDK